MKTNPIIVRTELDIFTVTRITIVEQPESVTIKGRYLGGEYEVIKGYNTLEEAKKALNHIWTVALGRESRMVDLTQFKG